MPKADGSIIINTKVDTTGMETGISRIEGHVSKLGSSFKKLGGVIAGAFAVKQIVAFAKECIELGSDLDEVQNVVDVTFGSMTGAIEEFSKSAATQFGISELAAKQYTSTIGAMYKSMGFTEQAAAGMSIEMTKLAADMASFYNLDADTAFQKIRSGISGETEPLKQLGINLSEANLEEYRLSQGIQQSYKEMNQQNKALLRYNYLLSVTSDAQGDFSRTSSSWANQVKILKLQFDSIKADLGQGFIAVFTPVLQMINKLLQGLARLASAFKAFMALITGKSSTQPTSSGSGITDMADSYTDATDSAQNYADASQKAADSTKDVAKATKEANKQNRRYLSGLDEIQRYEIDKDTGSSVSSGTGGKTSAASAAGGMIDTPVDFGTLETGETVVDELAQKMKNLYDVIKKGAQPAADALKNLWDNGLKALGGFVWQSLKDFYNLFLVPVGSWVMGTGIPEFINALNDGLMAINWQTINNGLAKLWKALAPFAVNVGEGLLWFWKNVLVPLGTWVMNEVVPRFLDTLSTAIQIVNTVINAAKPAFQWFWENVLLPIASWTGGIFLSIWDGINKALTTFADWCKKNPGTINTIASAVAVFFAAWEFAGFVEGIASVVAALGPLGLIIAAIIAVGALLIDNWDAIWATAQEVWGAITTWLAEKWQGIKDSATELKNKITGVFRKLKTVAIIIWNGLLTWISEKWEGLKTTATTVFGNIRSSITKTWTKIKTKATEKWDEITTTISDKWNGIKTGAVSAFNNIRSTVTDTWSNIKTKASGKWDEIKTTVSDKWDGLKTTAVTAFGGLRGTVTDTWSKIKTKASDKWSEITTTVTGSWTDMLTSASFLRRTLPNVFYRTFNAVKNFIKSPINAVIRIINALIRGIVTGMNSVIDALNKLSFSIPDWVPGLGGSSFGLNISRITRYPIIPELAKGAVIPPNAPFMAVVGDQKRGTNIEAPLETIKQAVREVTGEGGGDILVKLYLDGKVVYDNVLKKGRQYQQISGNNPFALE